MCQIIVIKERISDWKALRDLLTSESDKNEDGTGFAVIKDDKIYFEKAHRMSIKRLVKVAQSSDPPIFFHFRKATSGNTNSKNAHPFDIDNALQNPTKGVTENVLFHNGITKDWQEPLINLCIKHENEIPDGLSDTWGMAIIAKYLGRGSLSLIDDTSRWLVVTPKTYYLYGRWHEQEKGKIVTSSWISSFSNDGIRVVTSQITGGKQGSLVSRLGFGLDADESIDDAAWNDYLRRKKDKWCHK